MTSQILKFTKNRRILILLALIVLSGIILLKRDLSILTILGMEKATNRKLNYYFLSLNDISNKTFSLKVSESDFGPHENILNSLVGTLVKYMPSGKIEPYLAESFSVSSDKTVWTYFLRDGLTCDDGTLITAELFVTNLTKQIYEYSKKSSPIIFDQLIGYHEFISNGSSVIKGLFSDGNKIIFHFMRKPDDLNEMLRMPYFGFWHGDSFFSKSQYGIHDFISSGPYSVSKESTTKKVVLSLRKDWFSYNQKSAEKLIFSYVSISNLTNDFPLYYIFEYFGVDHEKLNIIKSSSVSIKAAPDMLLYLYISPLKNPFFKKQQNRQAFLNLIRKKQKNGINFYNEDSFYFNGKASIIENNARFDFTGFERVDIDIAAFNGNNSLIKDFLNSIFFDYPFNFSFTLPDDADPNRFKNILNKSLHSARFGSVMNGLYPKNSIVKMMFCTELGVNFSDPSGRICKLVNKYSDHQGPLPEEYFTELGQIIYDDATVIPLDHFGREFFISKNINPNSFPVTADHPLFDYLELK